MDEGKIVGLTLDSGRLNFGLIPATGKPESTERNDQAKVSAKLKGPNEI